MKRYIKSTSENGRKDAELLVTDGSWELWTPHTFEASIYLARKGADRDHWARWDTAYEGNGSRYFDQFVKKGPLYIFINKADPTDKYQYHAETNSFYDWNDRPADFKSFICEHPAFAEFFGIDCDDVEACDKVAAASSISSYNKYADALANHGYSKRKFIKALKEECTEQDLKDLLDNEADLHAYITGFIFNSDGKYDCITQEDASKLANEIISEVDNIDACDKVTASVWDEDRDIEYIASQVENELNVSYRDDDKWIYIFSDEDAINSPISYAEVNSYYTKLLKNRSYHGFKPVKKSIQQFEDRIRKLNNSSSSAKDFKDNYRKFLMNLLGLSNVESCDTVDASDTEYFANMVNCSSDLELDDNFLIEGYYDSQRRGLAESAETSDVSALTDLANEYANKGYYIVVHNLTDGVITEFSADNWFNDIAPDGGAELFMSW